MNSNKPPTRRRASRLLALVTTFVVAGGGLIVAPSAAMAVNPDQQEITSASLTWGTHQGWQAYLKIPAMNPNNFANPFIFTNGASSSGTTPDNFNWGTGNTGTYNPVSQEGSFDVPGGVQFINGGTGGHGIDSRITDVSVNFDLTAGTGTIIGDYTASQQGSADLLTGDDVVLANFVIPQNTAISGNTITVTNAATTGTSELVKALGGGNYANTTLPTSFTATFATAQTPTATTLTASTVNANVNTPIDFAATVTPANAAGSVQFLNNGTPLGAPVVVANGTAPLTTPFLTAGAQSITAVFTPTDGVAFASSASSAVVVTTVVPDTSVATTVTLQPLASGANLKAVGEAATATAAVTAAAGTPTGSVRFYTTNQGKATPAVQELVATVPVTNGTAVLSTTELTAGGNSITAEFVSSDLSQFRNSASTVPLNYNIYDPSDAALCSIAPGSGQTSNTPATLNWAWSVYGVDWAKQATGDISVEGNSFTFSGGEVVASHDCAVISFEGTLKVTSRNDPYVQLTDPQIIVNANGRAVLRAEVESSNSALPTPKVSTGAVTIATFAAPAALTPGTTIATQFSSQFANAVPLGSFSTGYADSWASSFIGALDPAQRAYFYRSGTSDSQSNKAASALNVNFAWPAVSTVNVQATHTAADAAGEPASRTPYSHVKQGQTTTLVAQVTPAATAQGNVTFTAISAATGETSTLGVAPVSAGTATLDVVLPAGGYTFKADFVSTNNYTPATHTSTVNYGVVNVAQPAVCTVNPNTAETLNGVSASWAWSEYGNTPAHQGDGINWPKYGTGNISVSGSDFVLSNGTAVINDNCASISFTGTMRVEAYAGFTGQGVHGQWIEVVNPSLTIDANGNGAWSGGVRSGSSELNSNAPVQTVIATISGADFPEFTGTSFADSFDLDYDGVVTAGSWATKNGDAFTGSWAGAFAAQVPSAIRSFYYDTGAAGDGMKKPAGLNVGWNMEAPTAAIAGGATVAQGGTITFTASGYRANSQVGLIVRSDPYELGYSTADQQGNVQRSWTVPADFPAGDHTINFTDEYGQTATAGFTVTAREAAAAPLPATVCVANAITGGSMNWGLKQSFVNYMNSSIAQGSYTGGSFSVSGGSVNVNEGGIGRINFAGAINATGHSGKLKFNLSNPSIQITGPGTAVLFAQISATKVSGEPAVNGTVAFANLSFAGSAVSASGISVNGASATLTAAGAQAFGGFYDAGTALDPVSFSASLGGEVACDSTTDPVKLAETGSTDNGMTLALGMGIMALLLGAGFLLARRSMGTRSA